MFLNHNPHFMAAKGYKRYAYAVDRLALAVAKMPEKPLRFVITRTTATRDPANPRIDHVPVVVLTPATMSYATQLAGMNIYCTSA